MLKVKFVDMPSEAIKNKTMSILRKHFEDVVECDDPDYLFYSVFGYEHLKYDCVRIEWLGENLRPDFNICDYAIGFDHLQFLDRYKRIPLYYFYAEDYARAREKHLCKLGDAENKKFCNFVYSNNKASGEREEFYKLLSTYKQVDSGGRYMNNIGGPVENKYEFQRQYKFSIAFENSSTDGYVTEKILQAFAAGTIPIYWGDPSVTKDFNEKAFINCHAYSNFEEVMSKVIEIDQNDELYYQYLREPIGDNEHFPQNPLEEYEKYIVDICSQTPDKAMRRSNIMYGLQYQEDQKKIRIDEKEQTESRRGIWGRIRNKISKL